MRKPKLGRQHRRGNGGSWKVELKKRAEMGGISACIVQDMDFQRLREQEWPSPPSLKEALLCQIALALQQKIMMSDKWNLATPHPLPYCINNVQ
jgi:hypothetical protein